MKKSLLTLALVFVVMTAAAQDKSVFIYEYDDDTQTATLTYKRNEDGGMAGGTYSGDVVIPEKAPNGYTVTTIGEYAFYRSHSMTSLTIPATIDSIGRRPFEDCNAHLKKIVIEDTDRLLRTYAMHYWAGREMVFGGQGVDLDVEEAYIGRPFKTAIDEAENKTSIFRTNEYLKTATLGEWYQEVPRGMFYGCKGLRTVNFSPNTKSIGYEAFYNCDTLSVMRIPEGVEYIDTLAFNNCDSLLRVTFPTTLKLIRSEAFRNCQQIDNISIPASVDSIGAGVFADCKALRHFTVEKGDTPLRLWSMHTWAGWSTVFKDMDNLETVTMGRPVICDVPSTYRCYKLRSFTYTYPAEEVADEQFSECENLRSVSFLTAPSRIGKEAFYCCQSLTSITLPEGVAVIDEGAFRRCNSLEYIGLPRSLRLIGGSAFNRCERFTRFTIPGSVDSIGVSILDDCDNLKRIDIAYSSKPLKYCCSTQFNNSLRSAPIDTLYMDRYIDGAFSDNRTLKKLYVGVNVKALRDGLFSDCYNMDEIYSLNPVPPTCEGDRVFYSGTKENGTLHVPAGSLDDYREAFVWKDFFNIVSEKDNAKGDVNGDNKVNGTDIQAVINVITDEEYVEEADINKDGKVNGTDIQEIINIIIEEE